MKFKQLGSKQAEIETANGTTVFFSYNTPVAAHITGKGFFRTDKKFSVTTSKHITKWLEKNGASKADLISQDALEVLLA